MGEPGGRAAGGPGAGAPWPVVIQGGMGAGVSHWRLARAVARAGQLGVVSGTALDAILARRLQDGDPDGALRRALAHFPDPAMARRVLDRYFIPGGRPPGRAYRAKPVYTARPRAALLELTVVANFAEVWLAKEGHAGPVGLNLLEKIQLPTLPSLYGALLAGVDYVLMGAGIPLEIPGALDRLARHEPATLRLHVAGAAPGEDHTLRFAPRDLLPAALPPLARPRFLAIVAAASLALTLARKATGRVDGFVVEGPTAGGHNAPPRGPLRLSAAGEPVYGPKDEADLAQFRALGAPFWLAGACGSAARLREALAAGAAGVQVGTAFAFCRESGLAPDLKARVVADALGGAGRVFTDPAASPTGYPFKVVQLAGTNADAAAYAARVRVCDLGYLRQPYRRADGTLDYRCPAEPVADYVRKGGDAAETVGRKCLCNALLANIGLPQRRHGALERALLTAGDDLAALARFVPAGAASYGADDVLRGLLGGTVSTAG
ncbi:MAG TPA: nitronate monooxygenase [Thermomicrobiales bacterium]|nr:nitronate monooxygenase [Thermomicrobiales bacterium]